MEVCILKKNTKGFTLVELIVVMAILTILMAAVFSLFKPINKVYIDASFLDKSATAVDGINNYICDNIKYSTEIWIINNAKTLKNVKCSESGGASISILQKFAETYNLDSDDGAKKIEVIAIYNEMPDSTADGIPEKEKWDDSTTYQGRVYRQYGCINGSGTKSYTSMWDETETNLAQQKVGGKGYYGKVNLHFETSAYLDNNRTDKIDTDNSRIALTTYAYTGTSYSSGKVKYSSSIAASFYNASNALYFDASSSTVSDGSYKLESIDSGNNMFIIFVASDDPMIP